MPEYPETYDGKRAIGQTCLLGVRDRFGIMHNRENTYFFTLTSVL